MDLLVHREGSPEASVVEVDAEKRVDELLAEAFGEGSDEYFAWVEDEEEPLDGSLKLASRLGQGGEVALARKVKIEVEVHFAERTESKVFGPNKRVQAVFRWAVSEDIFNIPRDQRPDHELALPGHDEPAESRAPVSAYADAKHRVVFDLRRKDGFQGYR